MSAPDNCDTRQPSVFMEQTVNFINKRAGIAFTMSSSFFDAGATEEGEACMAQRLQLTKRFEYETAHYRRIEDE